MSLHLPDIKLLAEKYNCGMSCSNCIYTSNCKHIDVQNIRYKPQLMHISQKVNNKEAILNNSKYLILPNIKVKSSITKKKLYDFILALICLEDVKCTAETLASYLNISLLQVQKRIEYLDKQRILELKSRGENIYLQFIDENEINDEKFKAITTTYIEEFKNKVQGANHSPNLESVDYIVIKRFCKKTNYTASQLIVLVQEYFNINQSFLKNTGYRLRNFPAHINSIVISKPELFNIVKSNISKDQLAQYEKGKVAGKWNGSESWAKAYEELLQNNIQPMVINEH